MVQPILLSMEPGRVLDRVLIPQGPIIPFTVTETDPAWSRAATRMHSRRREWQPLCARCPQRAARKRAQALREARQLEQGKVW